MVLSRVQHSRLMLGIVSDREEPTVHCRMECLDAPIHHFGKAGDLGDVDDRQAGIGQGLCAVPPVEISPMPRS